MDDGTKGNVYNNKEPLYEYYRREFGHDGFDLEEDAANGTTATTATAKNGASTAKGAAESTGTANVAAVSTSPNAAASSQKASEDSAAGKLASSWPLVAALFVAGAMVMVA